MATAIGNRAFRTGIALAIITSFLIVWTTIVADDGTGAGPFMIIMAAGAGAYATRLRADGMARAMLGVAVMQMAFTALKATAPITAIQPGGVNRAVVSGAIFAALWLVCAALFRRAGKT